jgi:hypothetical protein
VRVLLETECVPATCALPDGTRLSGMCQFQLFAFDPSEQLPEHGIQRPVSAWRRDLVPGETALCMSAPEAFEGATPATVPRALLESLPETDLLAFNWTFVPDAIGQAASSREPGSV